MGTYVFKDPKAVCKECKYFRPYNGVGINEEDRLSYGLCVHPSSTSVDIVSGRIQFEYAYDMRKHNNNCGIDARYFEKEIACISFARNAIDIEKITDIIIKSFQLLCAIFIAFTIIHSMVLLMQ
jgi:hypothetical protein